MRRIPLFIGAVILQLLATSAHAEEAPPADYKAEIDRLSERIAGLEAQMKVEEPKAKADEKEKVVSIYDGGYNFLGHNDKLKIAGWAQVDYRQFIGKHAGVDQFLIRRARLDVRGTLEKVWDYRLYMGFGGATSAKLQEAWLEYHKWEWFRVRMGQFKEPFSAEALTSARWIRFIERATGPSNLAPNEDIGIQVFGSLDCDKFTYAVAVYNGQGKNENDLNDSKDLAVRITYQPLRYQCDSIFNKLYLGTNFTTGYNKFDLDGKKNYTGLKTGFQTFEDNVEQRGNLFRYGIDFEWCYGSYWIGGEYIYHRRRGVRDADHCESVKTDAWYLAAAVLLTGEYQLCNKAIKPCRDFDPCEHGAWGAWEVGARYDEFQTNHKPFTKHLIEGTDKLREYTVGVVWWPTSIHIRIMGNFIYSDFRKQITVSGHKLTHEKGVVFRSQYVF